MTSRTEVEQKVLPLVIILEAPIVVIPHAVKKNLYIFQL